MNEKISKDIMFYIEGVEETLDLFTNLINELREEIIEDLEE